MQLIYCLYFKIFKLRGNMEKIHSIQKDQITSKNGLLFLAGSYSEYKIKKNLTSDDSDELYDIKIEKINDPNFKIKNYNSDQVRAIIFDDYAFRISSLIPLPVDDILSIGENNEVSFSKTDLTKNDYDLNDSPIEIVEFLNIKGGELVQNNSETYSFKLDPNFKSIPKFSYRIKNANGDYNITPAKVFIKLPFHPNETLFYKQWYLDYINVVPLWHKNENNYSGKNIEIAVLDEGFVTRHADIEFRNITSYSFEHNGEIIGHALNVASIIGAKKNDQDLIGIAYNAILDSFQVPLKVVMAMKLDFLKNYDIVNNSWGGYTFFEVDSEQIKLLSYIERKFKEAIDSGRNGLGTNIVVSAGNEFQQGGYSNLKNFGSNPYHIVVGGINKPQDILAIEYATPKFASAGSNILISAPASNMPVLTMKDINFYQNNISSLESINTNTQGTSFAAPIVSGIIALMLEANPKLSWLDVRNILSYTAKIHFEKESELKGWNYNQAKNINGIGLHFSNEFGFGVVNAEKAVKMAETWPISNANKKFVKASSAIAIAIAYENNIITPSNNVWQIDFIDNLNIEFIELKAKLNYNAINYLQIYLISPSGTMSTLLDKPGLNPFTSQVKVQYSSNHLDWSFGSSNFVDEKSAGTWKIIISTPHDNKDNGILNNISLLVYGCKLKDYQEQIIINNEFLQAFEIVEKKGESALKNENSQIAKINTEFSHMNAKILNLSALSKDTKIDLQNNQSYIGEIKINLPRTINIVILGDGDDSFYGDKSNVVYPGRGNDSICLGAGENKVIYHSLNQTIGHDKIYGFVSGRDKIIIKNKNFSEDLATKVISNIVINDKCENDYFTLKEQCPLFSNISIIEGENWSLTIIGNSEISKSDFVFE